MRTKELKKNTKYATENGTCVETYDTVERGWYRYQHGYEFEFTIQKGLPSELESLVNDPWSTRSKQPPKNYRLGDGTFLHNIVEGIRVKVHEVDGDGNSLDHKEFVLNPTIIKGTWEDYVRLHGDVLKSKALKQEADQKVGEKHIELSKRLKDAGLSEEDCQISVSVVYLIRDPRDEDGDALIRTHWAGSNKSIQDYELVPKLVADGSIVETLIDMAIEAGH